MKKASVLVATAIVAVGMFSCEGGVKKNVDVKTAVDSASYALGMLQGQMVREGVKGMPGEKLKDDLVAAAFETSLNGDTAQMKMTVGEAQKFLQTYFTEIQEKEAAKTKEEGEKFLAENKTKKDVITTESGLQYRVIQEGKGPKPTKDDKVKAYYTGKSLDGKKFDSSYDHGQEPAEFAVEEVVPGWKEVLQLMPVGSKYEIWLPAELAYGRYGRQGAIKPNEALYFELELVDIVK